ncbi:P-loop NTPase fold protein [Dietzia sp. PP-33]|uniref:P-loop NTPase fold protein n=1 Tax=Dietzia sp. PP-33 TaxID=2957500 RepID=UPI0029A1A297|nr:P-loop NTPase fold protein [Dietzia sp. PP-33]MDX2358787.1 P-loop NTPase fold protein [Dietzia sp. PP-33]
MAPPILEAWQNWLIAPSWCSQLKKHLAVLGVADKIWPRAAGKKMTYQTILRKVNDLLAGEQLLDRIKGADEPEAAAIRKSLAWVTEQQQSPRFGKCFAVTGRWGSGKSRVLAELSREVSNSQQGYTVFPNFGADTAAFSVCAAAEARFNTQFANIDDLIDFVETFLRSNLFIVFDDVNVASRQNSEFLAEFRELLDSLTRSTRIRWIMAANSADLDSIIHSTNGEFWVEYSSLDENSDEALLDISGWLDLDHANVVGQVGFTIMENGAGGKGCEERAIITQERLKFPAEYATLAQPVVGWLRAQQLVDGSAKPGLYAELNLASFVNIAWQKRLQSAADRSSPQRVIESVAVEIGQYCASAASWPVPEAQLLNSLAARMSRSQSEVANAATDLVRMGVLGRQTSGVFGDNGMLILTEDSFWGLRLADAFIGKMRDGSTSTEMLQAIDRWLSRDDHSEALTWSTLQFVSAGVVELIDGSCAYEGFAKSWMRSGLPAGALLQGALAGPSVVHGYVFPALGRKFFGRELENRTLRDRFALLRFIGAAYAEVNAATRFGRLQAHYPGIGRDGLSTYACFVVENVFRDQTLLPKSGLVGTFHSLVGSEMAGIASVAASAAELQGYRVHHYNLSELIRDIVAFLGSRNSVPLAESISRVESGQDFRVSREDYTHSASFWEELIDRAAERTVYEHGVGAVSFLADQGWYGVQALGEAKAVERSLVGSVTRALGRWYREGDRNDRDSYVKLVNQMCKSRKLPLKPRLCRREAVYLIRHSEVTRGRSNIVVDSNFYPALRTLAFDRDARRGTHLQDLCASNGIFYPEEL